LLPAVAIEERGAIGCTSSTADQGTLALHTKLRTLQPWPSDQDAPNLSGIEDGAHLFEAHHSKAVCFIDQLPSSTCGHMVRQRASLRLKSIVILPGSVP
jgi:hypothetical protein